VAALRAAVTQQFTGPTKSAKWRHRAAAGAAVFSLVSGAPAAAFAITGAPLPDPLRTALHAVELPVDSVAVADAKQAEADLRRALSRRNPVTLKAAATHLQDCLSDLSAADRARLSSRAEAMLQAADAELAEAGRSPGTETAPARLPVGLVQGGSISGSGSHSSGGSSPATVRRSGDDGASGPVTSGQSNGSSQPTAGTDMGGDGSGDTATTVPIAPATTSTTSPQGSDGRDGGGSGSGGGSDDGAVTTTTVNSSH
jgi:hypothetical protein